MLIGASLWAYMIGNVCGIVASLDVQALMFQQKVDNMNSFLREKRVPEPLQLRIREYLHQVRRLHQRHACRL